MFLRLRPHGEWRELITNFRDLVDKSPWVQTEDGENPLYYFSSGQNRAFGLALLLSFHLSNPVSPLNTLILDDPFQYIDHNKAVNLAETLSAIIRTGKQVIISVENPAISKMLCRRLQSDNGMAGKLIELKLDETGSAVVGKISDTPTKSYSGIKEFNFESGGHKKKQPISILSLLIVIYSTYDYIVAGFKSYF